MSRHLVDRIETPMNSLHAGQGDAEFGLRREALLRGRFFPNARDRLRGGIESAAGSFTPSIE